MIVIVKRKKIGNSHHKRNLADECVDDDYYFYDNRSISLRYYRNIKWENVNWLFSCINKTKIIALIFSTPAIYTHIEPQKLWFHVTIMKLCTHWLMETIEIINNIDDNEAKVISTILHTSIVGTIWNVANIRAK